VDLHPYNAPGSIKFEVSWGTHDAIAVLSGNNNKKDQMKAKILAIAAAISLLLPMGTFTGSKKPQAARSNSSRVFKFSNIPALNPVLLISSSSKTELQLIE